MERRRILKDGMVVLDRDARMSDERNDLFVFLPSHLFPLPRFLIFLLLQYPLISSTFGIIMDEKTS